MNYEIKKVYRIIDVNLNRAKEGLRVIEEYIRFYLENESEAFEKIRKIRHELSRISDIIYLEILSEREVSLDVGSKINENNRKEFKSVVIANFKRVEEALRVLEEFTKILKLEEKILEKLKHEKIYKIFKDFRFEIYALEKKICLKFF